MTIIVGGSEILFFSLNAKSVVHYTIPTQKALDTWEVVGGRDRGSELSKQNFPHCILWKIGAVVYL